VWLTVFCWRWLDQLNPSLTFSTCADLTETGAAAGADAAAGVDAVTGAAAGVEAAAQGCWG
jgi:hypothetical protein